MNDFQKAMEIVQSEPDVPQDVLIAIIDKIKDNLGAPEAIARVQALIKGQKLPEKAEQAARWEIVLAYLHFQNKETAMAGQVITKAIEDCQALPDAAGRDRNMVSALNVAGTLYMMNEEGKQFDQARVAYEQLITRKPGDLGALNNLACIWAEHTDPPDMKKAVDYSERALAAMREKQIEEPNVLDTYGWIQVLSGGPNIDKGIDKLQDSLKTGTEIPEAHYHLGEAYLLKGLPAAAKRSLETAQRMIYDKRERHEIFDEMLKKKVEDALVRTEKALLKQQ
jgi:tetratricopeptide (TPR) repeat protein